MDTAEGPGAPTEGGRSSRGPGNNPGGSTEPGGLVPPYDDRKQSADVDEAASEGVDQREGAEVAGAVQPTPGEAQKSPDPSATPGGRTASPAVEESAAESPGGAPVDEGTTGPAHIPGVSKGEEGGS